VLVLVLVLLLVLVLVAPVMLLLVVVLVARPLIVIRDISREKELFLLAPLVLPPHALQCESELVI
jgi:hypothetical protein